MNRKFSLAVWLLLAATPSWGQTYTLEQALKQAKQERKSIKAALLGVEQAKQLRKAAGAYAPTKVGVGLSSPVMLGATDQDLFIEQPLDFFGKFAAERRLGDAALLKAESEYRKTLLDVQTNVLQTFARAEAARETNAVCGKLREVAETLYQVTKKRFEEGTAPQIQVIRAKIELDRAKQKELVAAGELQSALSLLAGALGVSSLEAVEGSFNLSVPQKWDFESRPDVMTFRAEALEAKAEGLIAEKSKLPELSLIGLRSPWEERNGKFGARLQLTWNLLDHGKYQAEIRASEAKRKSLEAHVKDAITNAEAELKALDSEIQTAQEQVEAFQKLVTESRDLLDLIHIGFSEGVGSLVDVLEATRSLRELEEETVQAKLKLNLLLTQKLQVFGYVLEVLR